MNDTKELVLIAQQEGLQPSKVDDLMKSFAGYFNQARTLAEEAKSIVVKDETQTDLMLKARETRLALKNIRVEAEKTKIQLKEQSLREGNAIQGVYNVIKALIVPVEEHLEKQEKFIEKIEELPILEITENFWQRAGLNRAKIIAKKLKARLADTLIAQSCIDHKAPLLTGDTDFRDFVKYCGLTLL